MITNKQIPIKFFLLTNFIFLSIFTTGCQKHASRSPLSAQEVETLSAEYERVSNAHIQAWNSHDPNQMRQLYTDDIHYYEEGNTSKYVTVDQVVGLNGGVLSDYPDIEGRQAGIFISRENGFDMWEMWNYPSTEFTKDNPTVGYDWLTIREGKISTWWLFWGPEFFAYNDLNFTTIPLQNYATAWSSGDPQAVASLYTPETVRKDTLFKENQEGSSAIKEFATDFFSWYPGVHLELLKPFELLNSYPVMTGGVFAIHVTDQAGQPCDVHAIILLESKQDKIINEWMFYQADTLLACGWAR
jgi:nuclear transport factor 2 (NTF2) superfamily protein